jgi:nucleoside phosphorylase/CheY-like chemotaxis protein
MVNILIVEDNPDKMSLILKKMLQVEGINENQIVDVADVKSAKRLLKEKKFTLLILDINLPLKRGGDEEKLSGLKVLEFIKINNKAIPPSNIVGITADNEVFDEAQNQFSSLIWKVIKFSFRNDEWATQLDSTLKYLVANDVPPYKNDGKSYHIDVGVVCALEEELNALLAIDLNWEELPVKYDHCRYHKGMIVQEDEDDLTIIAVSSPSMGMNSAAVVSQKLISSFRPRMVAMIGICAGIRSETNIGDILVADPCFEWGSGKWVQDAEGKLELKPAQYPWRIDDSVRVAIKDVGKDEDFLKGVYGTFIGKRPEDPPKIIVNAMASGSSVLQSSDMVNQVVKQHKNLIGLEMESYAVFTAAELSGSPKPLCISMKSVCDFGDELKSDGYHKYACYTSAATLIKFINRWFELNR